MENTEDVSNRSEREQNELQMKDDAPLPLVSSQWDVYALRESRTWPDGLNVMQWHNMQSFFFSRKSSFQQHQKQNK
ncbi:hypothetical protein Scep_003984 [Stephania cephalantha]|uniref:Uncharacterized protein n=1 Tax=Stephania cephalantha TaxID=152367 RepID=A0AAP0KU42_9MAGN